MKRGSVLVSAALGAALTPLNSTMVAVALPALSMEFSAPAARVTLLVVTGYLIATIVSQMPAGAVADRVGYARALTWGRWTFGLGAAIGMLAPSLGLVVAGRLLMAAGGALMVPTAMALLRVAVPVERRPRAFGAMGAVMAGAAALGPAFGGLVIARASWRVLFLVNIPLTLLSWLLQPKVFEAEVKDRRRGDGHWQDGLARIFQTRAFVAGGAVIALQNFAMYALLVQVPFLFGGEHRGSSLGVAVMAMTAAMAITSPIGGRLAERTGAAAMVLIGGAAGAAGVIALLQLPPDAGAVSIGLCLLPIGLGLGLSTGPSQAASLSAIDPERSGMAAAALSTLRYAGAIASTAMLGLLLGGGGDVSRQHLALWLFALAFVLSALSGLGLMDRSRIR